MPGRQPSARARRQASATAPAPISVPREPVVCPAPSSRVVSTTTRTRSAATPSSSTATCSATVWMPWPISVQQCRTSTPPSSSNRHRPGQLLEAIPQPGVLEAQPEADRLAGVPRRFIAVMHGVQAATSATAPVVHDLPRTPYLPRLDDIAVADFPTGQL